MSNYPPKCPSCNDPLKLVGFGGLRFHCPKCDERYRMYKEGKLKKVKKVEE